MLEQSSSVQLPPPPVGGAAQAPAFDASAPVNPPPDVVVASARTREVYSRLSRAAQTTAPVLILGETGTGKDVVAHSVHALSKRADRTFVVVNCGAIPESLMRASCLATDKCRGWCPHERYVAKRKQLGVDATCWRLSARARDCLERIATSVQPGMLSSSSCSRMATSSRIGSSRSLPARAA